ncbi:MAG: PLP-dependent aminotransferase family protein [Legionellaceae bacterium]|nr:PLP-dependent aminotransferase family protein [Legionellaceae bacterium]
MSLPQSNQCVLPKWVQNTKPSAMENSLQYATDPTFISFALGLPAPELFPTQYIQEATHKILQAHPQLFQYAPPSEELKLEIVKLMSLRGVTCTPNQILLTTGAQQGISLLTRLLLSHGSTIIIEELAYPGMLQALAPFSPQILTVPTHPKTGICVESVEKILKHHVKPAFLYLVTDGGNPHGVSVSQEKRAHLAKLSEHYNMPIIEDDPYGFLNYETPLSPIKKHAHNTTFYIGSFSKILAPNLRVGWLIAPEYLIPKLASLKECSDINTSTLTQHIVQHILQTHGLNTHLTHLRQTYKKRRDALATALTRYFDNLTFHIPSSGIFLWASFKHDVHTTLLLEQAIKNHVIFIPSESFWAKKNINIYNGIRFNFSNISTDKINEGIKRLAIL